jgi:hypothetical protein
MKMSMKTITIRSVLVIHLMIQVPQVQRLRGDTHVKLDNVAASLFQRINAEVERSLRRHGGVTTNVAQFRQGFALMVLRSSPELGFR